MERDLVEKVDRLGQVRMVPRRQFATDPSQMPSPARLWWQRTLARLLRRPPPAPVILLDAEALRKIEERHPRYPRKPCFTLMQDVPGFKLPPLPDKPPRKLPG